MALPQRKNQRLQTWDYTQNASYFITFCTHGRAKLLGEIISDADGAHLDKSPIGHACEFALMQSDQWFPDVRLMDHVLMPNHVHLLISYEQGGQGANRVSSYVGMVKRMATVHAKRDGIFGALWQRSFHDHIIRGEKDMQRIREYIQDNPRKWAEDRYHIG